MTNNERDVNQLIEIISSEITVHELRILRRLGTRLETTRPGRFSGWFMRFRNYLDGEDYKPLTLAKWSGVELADAVYDLQEICSVCLRQEGAASDALGQCRELIISELCRRAKSSVEGRP